MQLPQRRKRGRSRREFGMMNIFRKFRQLNSVLLNVFREKKVNVCLNSISQNLLGGQLTYLLIIHI